MNWKDCICEVFVPTQGKTGNVGTGFPITPEGVLTAAHLLENWDGRPIKLSWIHSKLKPCSSKWEDAKAAHRLGGEEHQQIDVALIECSVPAEVRPILTLSEQTHALGNLEWESEGFAEAAGVDEKQHGKSFAMSGKILIKPTRDIRFELTNLHAPNAPSGWKGASGSPVVVGRTIVGVITHNAGIEDPKTLWFTPVARFIDDPKLQELCGYDERLVRRQAFLELIKKLLDRHPSARDALARPLACNATKVCIALLESDIPSMLECCKTAWDALQCEPNTDGCKVISDLLNHLLPALFDHAVVEHVRSRKMDIEFALFDLPVGLTTLAGVIMAGVDRKPFAHHPRSSDSDYPSGKMELGLPPESGFDPDGKEFLEAWIRCVNDKFAPSMEHQQDLFGKCDSYLGKIIQPGIRSRMSSERLRNMASKELTRQGKRGKTRYFVVNAVHGVEWREDLDRLIETMKRLYPALVFLRLSQDEQVIDRDFDDYANYRDLLPIVEDH